MLVLERQIGERLVFPDKDLTIEVVDIRGGKIKLGITAPKSLKVYRSEVWLKICEEQGLLLPPVA